MPALVSPPYTDYDHVCKLARGYHFTIDRHGRWYCHDPDMATGPLRREALARLFAGAGKGVMAGKGLARDEEGEYWLRAPACAYRVEVEDFPFRVVDWQCEGQGRNQVIDLMTDYDETVPLGPDHPLTLERLPDQRDTATPVVPVRDGLYARLGRQVFYALADLADEQGATDGKGMLVLYSRGTAHSLGNIEEG